MPAPYATHRKQLELILRAWGMPEATASGTAEIMSWADLHGIDTHGISMVPPYDERRRNNKLDMRAEPKVVKETRRQHHRFLLAVHCDAHWFAVCVELRFC